MSERMTTTEYRDEMAKAKPSKYRNEKTVVDGHKFDSKKEANRYGDLKILVRKKEIFELQLQPKFYLRVNGHLVCTYTGDFAYRNAEGNLKVEDVKSEITRKKPIYRLKKKLMFAIYGIDILET